MNTAIGFQAVIDHFKRNGWSYQVDETHLMLHATFQGANGSIRFVLAVDASDDFIEIVSLLPFTVPPERRSAVAELCIRLGSNLKMGRFDMNYENGGLRLHNSCAYPKGELKDDIIRRVIAVNLTTVDRHFPAFGATLYANTPAAVTAAQLHAKLTGATGTGMHPPIGESPRLNLN